MVSSVVAAVALVKATFDFYGLIVEVVASPECPLDDVRRGFSFFELDEERGGGDPRGGRVVIHMNQEAPYYSGLPAAPATALTPRNVSFVDARTSYIDYFGRGLVIYDRETERCDVYTEDPYLLREIVYLFVLSTVGRHLDNAGLHRLHALGVSYKQHAILLLPSGGGKSTLALALLARPGFDLLSEDTPLIDRKGRVLPFQLPLGVRLGGRTDIPERHLRTVRRMEFEPKTLVDLAYFGDRISSEPALPSVLLVGRRNLGEVSSIAPISRLRMIRPMIKNLVVGIYQGLEFLLERSLWETLGKVGVGLSRLYNGLCLVVKTRPYLFVMGRNRELNLDTLINFIEREHGPPEVPG